MSAQAFSNVAAFRTAMHRRHPAAIVMEVDFNGPSEGLRLAEQVQQGLDSKLPMLFFSHLETDTDRKSVVSGTSVSVRVDIGGRRLFKKQKIITINSVASKLNI